MALIFADVKDIIDLIKRGLKPSRILSLGHPDILSTPDQLAPLLGGFRLLVDNEKVREERVGPSPETCVGSSLELFDFLRTEITIIEKRNVFGVDENLDLNYPLAARHTNIYTLVIDPGTVEHIFNIGTVLSSIVRSLKVGGYVYHASPLNMYNHGYWNISPVAYNDFYTSNGFEIVRIDGRRKKGKLFDIPNISKFIEAPPNSLVVCVARKTADVDEIVWPMQRKYM